MGNDPPQPTVRPSYTVNGASISFKVPKGWLTTFSAISRKAYQHLVVSHSSANPLSRTLLSNKFNKINAPMLNMATEEASAVRMVQATETILDFSFYYTKTKTHWQLMYQYEKPENKCYQLQVLQTSKPQSAPKDIPDYLNIFVYVEDTPVPQSARAAFDDMVLVLQFVWSPTPEWEDEPENNNPDPPKEENVNDGYNPILDKKRPATIKNYLGYYDTVFLLDDSGSMNEGSPRKWDELKNALIGIADTAIDNDTDGIDIYFLNSNDKFRMKDELHNVDVKSKVPNLLTRVGPGGGTPTGQRVEERLQAHLAILDAAIGTTQYGEIKPMDLIVITDGVPTDDPKTKDALEAAAKHVKDKRHHSNCMGIQFVQIGNDAGADAALQALVNSNNGSMVDSVPYKQSLTPDELKRILLGGLHPNIRRQQQGGGP